MEGRAMEESQIEEEPRWGPPIAPEPEPTLLGQALELLKDYQVMIERLCEQATLYAWSNTEEITDLQKRLLEIIKEYQEQLFAQQGFKEVNKQ
jgi:hypothetical protein